MIEGGTGKSIRLAINRWDYLVQHHVGGEGEGEERGVLKGVWLPVERWDREKEGKGREVKEWVSGRIEYSTLLKDRRKKKKKKKKEMIKEDTQRETVSKKGKGGKKENL